MKTNFPLRNKRSQHKRKEVLIAALVLGLSMAVLSMFGDQLSQVLAPLWHSNIYMRSGVKNFVGSLRSKDALIAENTRLKDSLASDEELIVSLRAIAASRDELLSTFGRLPLKMLPASVLVHPPETPYDILIVDVGDKDASLALADPVFTPEGSMIGTLTSIFPHTSQVKLFSTAGERTNAVLERGGVSIMLIGKGGGNFEFAVPRETPVSVGDRILSPRIQAELIGVVGDIEVTPTDSEKTVLVRSPINPNDQRYVLIEQ